LVDGGYFESSAIETAHDIFAATIRQSDQLEELKGKLKVYLVVVMGYEGIDAKERNLGEVLAPAQALVSTWQSRAEFALSRALLISCPGYRCMERGTDREMLEIPPTPVLLNLRDIHIPLGWQLSRASRDMIQAHAGVPARCTLDSIESYTAWPVRSIEVDEKELESTEPGARKRERLEKQEQRRNERMLAAIDESNCMACLIQYKLASRDRFPRSGVEYPCRPPSEVHN
jgi:hypothetical protein